MNAIKHFKEQIIALQEVDIGDFKRRMILYINRLGEEINNEDAIQEIKSVVLYEDLTDMEEIREKVLNKIRHFNCKP